MGDSTSWPISLKNCLVDHNRAIAPGTANYRSAKTYFQHSRTTPLPHSPGNIDADPRLMATVPVPVTGQKLIDPAAASESRLFYRAASLP